MIHPAKEIIEKVWNERSMLEDKSVQSIIRSVIFELDKGTIRVAEPLSDGSWQVNEWVKKAVILYFPIQKMRVIELG
ncbi:MAG: 2,3,4,5-tetrahydropyridine-2,6-dicarboxylate N-succinyltransferase, partial [Bacteroidia bacterium]|nr:2,3,4,5-tetrahydropyridine-2,6-dicarboxylate N-succinyltransferase [Bacteroidia bacterium]